MYSPGVFKSNLSIPLTTILFVNGPSSLSSAVIPSNSLNVLPTLIVTLSAPVITGAPSTFTILFIVVTFPNLSVTVYVIVYSPGVFTSNLSIPLTTILFVNGPSSLSSAVTPSNSLNALPTLIVTLSAPVITGAPSTIIVLSIVTSFPATSLTVYFTVYCPGVFTSTLSKSDIFILEVKSPSKLSLAVTPSNSLNVPPTLIVTSLVPYITGVPYTFTTLSSVTSFSAASLTVYWAVYCPGISTFTSCTTVILKVKSTPKLSLALTPFDLSNVSPTLSFNSSVPLITGSPYTFTFLSTVTSFPALSLTV